MIPAPRTALILSGGGSRGAYEAGVVQGIVEVLGRSPGEPAPFQLFAGTSVGAINAAFLASRAHRGDLDVATLTELWRSLSVRDHMRLASAPIRRRALLDVGPIEDVVRAGVDWTALRDNVATGRVRALLIAALEVETGRTTLFIDAAREDVYAPSRDPSQRAVRTAITAGHVLASAAIPAVFPPRRIGEAHYYDGGLRFNTPMSPAIRAGADRLVVISPLFQGAAPLAPSGPQLDTAGPDVIFLAGKMLNAVLLDPFAYDLQVLQRFNALLDVVEQTQDHAARRRLDEAVRALRGAPYRRLQTLVVQPSEDLGAMAVDHLARHARTYRRQGAVGLMLSLLGGRLAASGSDLVSYLLFEGSFTERLVRLGRQDAHARAAEIRAFFAPTPAPRLAAVGDGAIAP